MIAVEDGNVKDLLDALSDPLCDPKADDSRALLEAVKFNNLEMVEILLPFSDATAMNSRALTWSVIKRNHEIFDLLLPFSDPGADPFYGAFIVACGDSDERFIRELTDTVGYQRVRSKLVELIEESELRQGDDAYRQPFNLKERLALIDKRELAASTVSVAPTFMECVEKAGMTPDKGYLKAPLFRRL